jgi:hypothetical protein
MISCPGVVPGKKRVGQMFLERIPGNGNSNFHGARPVHLIITIIKWIQNSSLSINDSLSVSKRHFPQARMMLRRKSRGG